jgi:hypothetical protein
MIDGLGINTECGEIYHDLSLGGASHICELTRGHAGPCGKILVVAQTESAVEKNAKFNAFMDNLLSDIATDQRPVESSSVPPKFMHGG